MKECDISGVKTYSDPSYIFSAGQDSQPPVIYAPIYSPARFENCTSCFDITVCTLLWNLMIDEAISTTKSRFKTKTNCLVWNELALEYCFILQTFTVKLGTLASAVVGVADGLCLFCFFLCWFVSQLISAVACCSFIICLSLSVFRLCKTVSVKNGWPAR